MPTLYNKKMELFDLLKNNKYDVSAIFSIISLKTHCVHVYDLREGGFMELKVEREDEKRSGKCPNVSTMSQLSKVTF